MVPDQSVSSVRRLQLPPELFADDHAGGGAPARFPLQQELRHPSVSDYGRRECGGSAPTAFGADPPGLYCDRTGGPRYCLSKAGARLPRGSRLQAPALVRPRRGAHPGTPQAPRGRAPREGWAPGRGRGPRAGRPSSTAPIRRRPPPQLSQVPCRPPPVDPAYFFLCHRARATVSPAGPRRWHRDTCASRCRRSSRPSRFSAAGGTALLAPRAVHTGWRPA